jgi:hypothetical protein
MVRGTWGGVERSGRPYLTNTNSLQLRVLVDGKHQSFTILKNRAKVEQAQADGLLNVEVELDIDEVGGMVGLMRMRISLSIIRISLPSSYIRISREVNGSSPTRMIGSYGDRWRGVVRRSGPAMTRRSGRRKARQSTHPWPEVTGVWGEMERTGTVKKESLALHLRLGGKRRTFPILDLDNRSQVLRAKAAGVPKHVTLKVIEEKPDWMVGGFVGLTRMRISLRIIAMSPPPPTFAIGGISMVAVQPRCLTHVPIDRLSVSRWRRRRRRRRSAWPPSGSRTSGTGGARSGSGPPA